ncbi:MAG: bifunctional adenosylcobinamide kinase/adenosylcobinamide-phosphate guanylyltransferase [Ruminococcus sp.]|uniref:bifunctional adenosylcobinamide kinase/adenosylcobinamide-phosphate guanylyltransferase n=1 Tax=Ruminococcus sp. TaxID=41978 RepID=UPI0025EB65D8|nr:bifunctional adenosylcobinamide kinase/adenosylcobinamide-phosphate guanylyltransferase [Ruminococcus sp.]MCR4796575.1 bifunctional adenosylcobinamide kinase/adenosylcobinamide-phosphate guanylyltransferase [Ruminococcus sp.]
MITLVTGGSKCGKSRYAEKLFSLFGGEKYYIATMVPFGAEAWEIIARHRKMREGKGYVTVECQRDVGSAEVPENSGILLECMGNLCANEMFAENDILKPADKIVSDIKSLSERVSELIIVTNEVSCDGIDYSPETMLYISQLSEINRRISEFADNVIECVYGIPVPRKGAVIC